MFAILEMKSQTVSMLVYNALVFIINFLVDEKKKYTNFKIVLDTYIERQFSGTTAHKHLMMCLKHVFDELETNPSSISKIIPTLKAIDSFWLLN